jgi:hypothetical protein
MTTRTTQVLPVLSTFFLLGSSSVFSCSNSTEPSFIENVDITVCDPSKTGFTITIDNPYFPLAAGAQSVFDGQEAGAQVHIVATVLDSTVDIAGVTTRILEEREQHNGTLAEVSRNFFVQASNGAVCYYGEDVDLYAGGVITGHEGQWRAGANGALPGIFVPDAPAVGMAFREEVAPGVAQDRGEIVAAGETVTVPAGTFTQTIRTRESSPLESGSSKKVFAEGVGLIVDDEATLTSRTP